MQTINEILLSLPKPTNKQIAGNYLADYLQCANELPYLIEIANGGENSQDGNWFVGDPLTFVYCVMVSDFNFTLKAALKLSVKLAENEYLKYNPAKVREAVICDIKIYSTRLTD